MKLNKKTEQLIKLRAAELKKLMIIRILSVKF